MRRATPFLSLLFLAVSASPALACRNAMNGKDGTMVVVVLAVGALLGLGCVFGLRALVNALSAEPEPTEAD